MTNIAKARAVIEEVCRAGVREFCVCSGSRNTPLLAVLAATSGVRLFSFVDERSAGFFALGRMKLHGAPVAVVTTSGTAAAELLPALVEAHYAGLPLYAITADRPARFRGTGAPQSIEQRNLFGVYGGRHINVAFDEPLLDEPVEPLTISPSPAAAGEGGRRAGEGSRAVGGHRPLIILGGLAKNVRDRVRTFATHANATLYAEPLSGLREELADITIHHERSLQRGNFDSIIRIGNVPTLRFWRDLEARNTPITHYSRLPFPGLTRGEVRSLDALPEPMPVERDESVYELDREMSVELAKILDDEPESEQAMFRVLSRELPEGARIYLGNSLPIREWDLAATRARRCFEVEANRGANGIDGQLSTFFGWCAPNVDNVAIVGDLTALYDLGAPWIVPQLGDVRCHIVVINNRGGRIFERVPVADRRLVINEHALRFDKWGEMFGIDVAELRPDLEATRCVWSRYEELWK
jgi:2-succinyl-5-enolpyruvyl-6-hydroxy-3-cyclohexene-1-carboxylate synthase